MTRPPCKTGCGREAKTRGVCLRCYCAMWSGKAADIRDPVLPYHNRSVIARRVVGDSWSRGRHTWTAREEREVMAAYESGKVAEFAASIGISERSAMARVYQIRQRRPCAA